MVWLGQSREIAILRAYFTEPRSEISHFAWSSSLNQLFSSGVDEAIRMLSTWTAKIEVPRMVCWRYMHQSQGSHLKLRVVMVL